MKPVIEETSYQKPAESLTGLLPLVKILLRGPLAWVAVNRSAGRSSSQLCRSSADQAHSSDGNVNMSYLVLPHATKGFQVCLSGHLLKPDTRLERTSISVVARTRVR